MTVQEQVNNEVTFFVVSDYRRFILPTGRASRLQIAEKGYITAAADTSSLIIMSSCFHFEATLVS